jgi:hypothetical protein
VFLMQPRSRVILPAGGYPSPVFTNSANCNRTLIVTRHTKAQ